MENSPMLTFRNRPGTTDRGKHYEDTTIAHLILKLVHDNNVEEFYLSSNDKDYGAFDDVVVEVRYRSGGSTTWALQLKPTMLKRNLPLSSFAVEKGYLSLKKYYESFKKFGKSESSTLILVTTGLLNLDKAEISIDEEQIIVSNYDQHPLLATSKVGRCYQFKSTKEDSKYNEFFEHFYLYTNQLNMDELEKTTEEMFCSLLDSGRIHFFEYLQYITHWNFEGVVKPKLSKTLMNHVITLLLLRPLIIPWNHSRPKDDEKSDIFREAILDFEVICISHDKLEQVRDLWNADQDVSRAHISLISYRPFKTPHLDNCHLSILMWLNNSSPLMVTDSKVLNTAINFSSKKNFIVLSSDYSCPLTTFKNLTDLEEKNDQLYNDVLDTFCCSIQGEKVVLRELVSINDSIAKHITTDHLSDMLNNLLIVGESPEELPPSHIKRRISRIFVDVNFLKKMKKETLVVVTCVPNIGEFEQHFSNYVTVDLRIKNEVIAEKQGRTKEKRTIYVSEDDNFDFQQLPKNKKYHHFTFIPHAGFRTFEWIKSSENVDELCEFSLTEDEYLEQNEVFANCSHNRVNIVCAKPGMGKTTLLKSLKNSSPLSTWAVMVFARKHTKHFRSKKSDLYEFDELILDNVRKNCMDLDLQIFKALKEKGRVTYFWDGLDEVSEAVYEVIINVIQDLARRDCNQWVSARTNLKSDLEFKFNVLSRTIKPFDDLEQKLYIEERLQCNDSQIPEIFDKIKKNIQIFSSNDVLGIPLQIYMLTELFQKDQEKYMGLITETFSIADLYEYFVEEKFKSYFENKLGADLSNELLYQLCESDKLKRIKGYQTFSLKLYFDKKIIEKWDVREELKKEKSDPVGFITNDEFFHSSFGEYFTALYLSENLKIISDIVDDFFTEKLSNIRFFFDLILSKDCKGHMAVLYRNPGLLETCSREELTKKDKGGRNPLHLVCSWAVKYPSLDFQEQNNSFIIDDTKIPKMMKTEDTDYQSILEDLSQKIDASETDHVFKFDAFSYALQSQCLLALAMVLSTSKEKPQYPPKVIYQIFYHAIKADFSTVFREIGCIPYIKSKKFPSLTNLAVSFNAEKCLQEILTDVFHKKQLKESKETFLHKACENGNIKIVKILLQNEANVNAKDGQGRTPLHVACTYGNYEITDLLLKEGSLLNVPNKFERLPIHQACINGHSNVAKLLINEGDVNMEKADKFGKTPLHYACLEGHFDIVKVLEEHGASLKTTDKENKTSMHYVCEKGFAEIFKFLIQKVPETKESVDKNDKRPLHYACKSGSYEIVKELINNGVDLNKANKNGMLPLDYACVGKNYEIAKLLIDEDADLTIQDKDGKLFVHRVCERGDLEILEYLISKCSDVTKEIEGDKKTPLHLACDRGHSDIVEMLLKEVVDKEIKDISGKTPLHYACASGCLKVVIILINNGIDFNVKDHEGQAPLHYAYDADHYDIVELLVESMADVEVADRSGKMLIHRACEDGKKKVVELLIDNDADLELTDESGETPIHYACASGHYKIVQLLLNNGVDFNNKNQMGNLPIDEALNGDHQSIVELLESKMYNILKFRKRPGTTDRGKHYEDITSAHLILTLVQDNKVKEFYLSSNDDSYGAFDDVVINVLNDNEDSTTWALQLKHKTNKTNLSLEIFTNDEKGKFSLKKYYKSFNEFEKSRSCKLLLVTPELLNLEKKTEISLDDDEQIVIYNPDLQQSLLATSANGRCYQFKSKKQDSKYNEFFKNFYLYTNQLQVDELQKITEEKFHSLFDSARTQFSEYLEYVSKWSLIEGDKPKLSKTMMNRVITLLLLTPSIQPWASYQARPEDDRKTGILKEAILNFKITCISPDKLKQIQGLWGISDNADQQVYWRHIVFLYYHSPRMQLPREDYYLSILMWLNNLSPLMVTYSKVVSKAIDFSSKKNFIVLSSGRSCSLTTFKNLTDLQNKNGKLYNDVLGTFCLSIQGKEVVLYDIVKINNNIAKHITPDHLSDMWNPKMTVGKSSKQLPQYHIKRLISRIFVKVGFLEEIEKESMVVVTSVPDINKFKEKFSNYVIKDVDENKKDVVEEKKPIYVSHGDDFDFEQLSKKYHHFKFDENVGFRAFEWMKSSENVNKLREFSSTEDMYLKENEVFAKFYDGRINIICAEPGMGKTRLLESLKNSSPLSTWTVFIFAKKYTLHFKKKKDNLTEFDNRILSDVRQNCSSWELQIFKILKGKGQVTYFWDGLDEVSEEVYKSIVKVIHSLAQRGCMQWVSARTHLKSDLENEFNVLSRTIKPFDDPEQRLYVKQRLPSNDNQIPESFDKIKKNIQLFSGNDILGIPRQLYVLTDLLQKDQTKTQNETFSIADLYQHFVDEKFKFYFENRLELDLSNELHYKLCESDKLKRIKSYQFLSLNLYFDKNIIEKWDIREKLYNEKNDPVGFVINKDYHEFFHSSFGEYFAASYLSENLKNISDIREDFFADKLSNMRLFFDLILSNDCKSHIAVLYRNPSLLKTCDSEELNKKDRGDRNPLHLAFSWGIKWPSLDSQKQNDLFIIDDKKKAEVSEYQLILEYLSQQFDASEKDNLFQFDAFTYARHSQCVLALAMFLSNSEERGRYPSEFIFQILYYAVITDFRVMAHIPYNESETFPSFDAENSLKEVLADTSYRNQLKEIKETYLHTACKNNYLKIVEILLEFDTNMNNQDRQERTPLYVACSYGNYEITDLLLKKGSLLNAPDKYGRLPIHQSCINGHTNVANRLILENDVKMEEPDRRGRTPLHYACLGGYSDIVEIMVVKDINIEAEDKNCNRPIHLASQKGFEKIVRFLAVNKAKLDMPDKFGKMPIHYACEQGHYSVVKVLEEHGASLKTIDEKNKTSMHYVCEKGFAEIFEFLIQKVPETKESVDKHDRRPLHYACKSGCYEIVKELINNGVDLNKADKNGMLPLDYACVGKNYEIAKLLIDEDADLTIQDKSKKLFVHRVCERGDLEILEYLISKCSDVTKEIEGDKKTPLHLACELGHSDIVEMLLKKVVDKEIKDISGKTPLHYACASGYLKVVVILINNDIDLNVKDNEGEAPLHYAYDAGHYDIVELLVESMADVEVADGSGKMLIHRACKDGKKNVLELLIDNNADLELTDASGETPIHYACASGHYEIVQLLLNNDVDFNNKNHKGNFPIDEARNGDYQRVVKLLESKMNN